MRILSRITSKAFSQVFRNVDVVGKIKAARTVPESIPRPDYSVGKMNPGEKQDIYVYSQEEIEKVKTACKITAEALIAGRNAVKVKQ